VLSGYTLHVRLTKRCNADCSYCSSRSSGGLATKVMTADEYRQSLERIVGILRQAGLPIGEMALTIQYVGGEILTVPKADLANLVMVGQEVMGVHFGSVIDGAQSNLIASEDRVMFLSSLFGRRLSTSIDAYTDQRTLDGSPDKYRQVVKINIDTLKRRRQFIAPAIFVVDHLGLPHIHSVISDAEVDGQALRLRPVFQGGSDINVPDVDELALSFGLAARNWLMKSRVRVDPFAEMLDARLRSCGGDGSAVQSHNSCPFSDACGKQSLCLEPNGDLFLCLDMADAGLMPLGNALTGGFDYERLAEFGSRNLHQDCRQCEYLEACRGGCQFEAVKATGSTGGKTPLCRVWKSVFSEIDQSISQFGAASVEQWLRGLN